MKYFPTDPYGRQQYEQMFKYHEIFIRVLFILSHLPLYRNLITPETDRDAKITKIKETACLMMPFDVVSKNRKRRRTE
ncbi:MAG: hypothetical protein AB7J40_01910 [Candidatus Altimarinota bacterium]